MIYNQNSNFRALFTLGFLVFGAGTNAWSKEKICNPYFELVNLPDSYQMSSLKTLEAHLEQEGVREFLIPGESESISAQNDFDANLDWAKSQGCSYLHLGTFIRLGETVQVSSKTISVSGGAVLNSKAYKAEDPSDLNPILQQISHALSDENFEGEQTIYDVARSDAKALRKKRSNMHYSGHIGYLGFLAPNASSALGFGGAATWDARSYIAEFEMSLMNLAKEQDAGVTSFAINLYKPLSNEDKSFYIGGGTGLAFFSIPQECPEPEPSSYYYYDDCEAKVVSASFLLQGSAGYIVGRTNDINFRIQADLKAGLTQVGDSYPVAAGVKFILGFEE